MKTTWYYGENAGKAPPDGEGIGMEVPKGCKYHFKPSGLTTAVNKGTTFFNGYDTAIQCTDSSYDHTNSCATNHSQYDTTDSQLNNQPTMNTPYNTARGFRRAGAEAMDNVDQTVSVSGNANPSNIDGLFTHIFMIRDLAASTRTDDVVLYNGSTNGGPLSDSVGSENYGYEIFISGTEATRDMVGIRYFCENAPGGATIQTVLPTKASNPTATDRSSPLDNSRWHLYAVGRRALVGSGGGAGDVHLEQWFVMKYEGRKFPGNYGAPYSGKLAQIAVGTHYPHYDSSTMHPSHWLSDDGNNNATNARGADVKFAEWAFYSSSNDTCQPGGITRCTTSIPNFDVYFAGGDTNKVGGVTPFQESYIVPNGGYSLMDIAYELEDLYGAGIFDI